MSFLVVWDVVLFFLVVWVLFVLSSFSVYKSLSLRIRKRTNSSTQKLKNSNPHQLINSKTQKLKNSNPHQLKNSQPHTAIHVCNGWVIPRS